MERVYCQKLGKIPSAWKQFIVPIYKGGNKQKTSPDSYRPISLLSTVFKVFEKIIYARICNVAFKVKYPNPQQQGFHKGLSSITAAFNLQETILHHTENGSHVYACFFRQSKSFRHGLAKGITL
jgi:hypothetical protein